MSLNFNELSGKLPTNIGFDTNSGHDYMPAIGLNKNDEVDFFWSSTTRELNAIDTIVIHSMYAAEAGEEDQYSIAACIHLLNSLEVSAHYFIDKTGKIAQSVDEVRQAWQAGKSKMPTPDSREKVNAFSVGIELIGKEEDGFTEEQYLSLVGLVAQIMSRLPIRNIVGHSDIATAEVRPDPKTDPGVNFDWELFTNLLRELVGEEKIAAMEYLKGKEVYLSDFSEVEKNNKTSIDDSGESDELDPHFW